MFSIYINLKRKKKRNLVATILLQPLSNFQILLIVEQNREKFMSKLIIG